MSAPTCRPGTEGTAFLRRTPAASLPPSPLHGDGDVVRETPLTPVHERRGTVRVCRSTSFHVKLCRPRLWAVTRSQTHFSFHVKHRSGLSLDGPEPIGARPSRRALCDDEAPETLHIISLQDAVRKQCHSSDRTPRAPWTAPARLVLLHRPAQVKRLRSSEQRHSRVLPCCPRARGLGEMTCLGMCPFHVKRPASHMNRPCA